MNGACWVEFARPESEFEARTWNCVQLTKKKKNEDKRTCNDEEATRQLQAKTSEAVN